MYLALFNNWRIPKHICATMMSALGMDRTESLGILDSFQPRRFGVRDLVQSRGFGVRRCILTFSFCDNIRITDIIQISFNTDHWPAASSQIFSKHTCRTWRLGSIEKKFSNEVVDKSSSSRFKYSSMELFNFQVFGNVKPTMDRRAGPLK